YMVLIKLLYLAERKSLVERGVPITGDRFVSMDNGPVLSKTYDIINMGTPVNRPSPWYELMSEPERYEVHVTSEDIDFDELSEYECNVLRDVFKRFGKMNKWKLVEETHNLPEWSDPSGSSLPIEYEAILRFSGVSEERIKEYSD